MLRNEKYRNPNFDSKTWFRRLQVYQLLVDEAQVRGIDKTDDWLEISVWPSIPTMAPPVSGYSNPGTLLRE
ncbi:MAG: hypothetical protein R3E39_06610 [Anaerolineae bacterium]